MRKPSIPCFLLLAAALCATAVTPAARSQNLLVNPSFESLDASASPFYIRSFASTPGWTQTLDGVDLIHTNYTQPNPIPVLVDPSDGAQFIDMNQAGAIGGIEQVVSATAGLRYRLTLDATAWAVNSRGGTVGYFLYDPASSAILASGTFTDPTGGVWVPRTIEADAISSQIGVRIQEIAANQAGIGVDNVRLAVVPEPSAALLLPLAGAASWLCSRWLRTRRRAA